MSLGSFLEALEARLTESSPQQLRAVLLAHAERLVPRERTAFLAIFAERAHESTESRAAGKRPDRDPLIGEIGAFVKRLREGAYVDGWGWDDEIHEERAFGDESWVDEMDALFAAASEAFLDGEMELAREALGLLLGAFELEGEAEAFCGPDSPEVMVSTDVAEAKVRYLRALFETTPAGERPAVLLDAMLELRYRGGEAGIGAIGETRRAPPPELEAFLPAWIAHLRAVDEVSEPSGSQANHTLARLLSEAAELQGGADGLGELARARGARDPGVHRDWVSALVRAGRHREAAGAAREALALIGGRGQARASIAELLTRLCAAGGDADGALAGRCERWRSAPSISGLLALVDIATALGRVREVLIGEAAWSLEPDPSGEGRNVASDRLLCFVLLLAGRVDDSQRILEAAAPLGWSGGSHPGPVALPYLLIAATGPEIRPELLIAVGPLPGPDEAVPLLAQELDNVDRDRWIGVFDALAELDDGAEDEPGGTPLDVRYSAIPAEKRLPSYLLGRALCELRSSPPQRERWLAAASRLVEQRVAAIVTAKHRGAYERAARLTVACGEAIALARQDREGAAFVAEIRSRFPRHYAFRDELDRATRRSPLLPSPLARRR